MSRAAIDARFIDGSRGRLFVLLRRPPTPSGGPCVLIAPPFAEEMNKSRALFTQLAEALAARGVATVLPDLHGTGDSEGEFRDADLRVWSDDLCRSMQWCASQGWHVTSMVGVRLGCILGASAARSAGLALNSSVFWQPVTDGKRFLTQVLRLRVAASMMSSAGKESVEQLRAAMREGRTVEAAGYELTPLLADQLDAMSLTDEMDRHLGQLLWIEIVRDAQGAIAAGSQRLIEAARVRGLEVRSETVLGEPFWSSTEIVRNDELIARTVDALGSGK